MMLMMLFPKFSIRQMLLLMVAIGIVSACLAGAFRGNEIAFGLAAAMISTLMIFLVYGIFYWVAMGLILVVNIQSPDKSRSQVFRAGGATEPELADSNQARGRIDE